MATVLCGLSFRGASFCGRSTEKGTGKMVEMVTYLKGSAQHRLLLSYELPNKHVSIRALTRDVLLAVTLSTKILSISKINFRCLNIK